MNMFKSRRKAKEQSDAFEAFTAQSPTTYKTSKGLRRKKTIPEDATPTFNIASALPDDKDFRTSLLMPNLAARFSMLREQDDPNTKIGKASDDSVLFPKRASRMNLFNHNMLEDVDEVETLPTTFRPPFAERTNSVGEGYESDGGSVMSRSRNGEGNNLFGGRQRLYRIGTNSSRNLNESTGLGGRFIYDGDAPSFQTSQYKSVESPATEDGRTSMPATDLGESSDIASPATAFSKNRGTQSSTNSAPRRSSTAATSVASESPALRNSNATSESISRSGDHTVSTPDSVSSLQMSKIRDDALPNRFAKNVDKNHRPLGMYSSNSFRSPNSPVTVPTAQPLDFGFSDEIRSASAASRYQTDSPTPNQIPETDVILANNLQPNDRGKATALGLFNKPAKEFDEQQFNQRQKQLHDDNVSPMVNNSRSTSRASNDVQGTRQGSISVATTNPAPTSRTSTPQIPPIPSTTASPLPSSNRVSKASGRSTPPRPRSKSTASITAANNVKARIESLIQKQNAELAALEAEKLGTPDLKQEDLLANKKNDASAFFDNDDSDADFDERSNLDSSRVASSKIDESDIHPAFRNSYQISETYSRKSNHSNLSKTRSVLDDERIDTPRLQVPGRDSEVINGVGLSGLIRTHLRHNSGNSSISPRPDSSVRPESSMIHSVEPSRSGSIASTSQTVAESSRSDPFDLDANHNLMAPRASQARLTPTTAMSKVAQQFLSQAIAIKDAAEREKAQVSVDSTDSEASPNDTTWRDDLEPKHQRGESTETTKERREFDDELAARRRKIREGLKSVAERDRSQSPATTATGQTTTMQAFVQQRAVTDPQPKTMKMLGLHIRDVQSGPLDEERGRKMSYAAESRGPVAGNAFSKQTATHTRFPPEPTTEPPHPPRSATPPASRNTMRNRANSYTNDRSKSRTRPREANPPLPNPRGQFANLSQPTPSPIEDSQKVYDLNTVMNGHRNARSPPPDLTLRFPTMAPTRPSPISPSSSYDSPVDSARSPGSYPNGRTTPIMTNRKRSVNKTMISEPTFVSSTSSVPLVHLSNAQSQGQSTPPVPTMNPRRRGNTANEKPVLSPIGFGFSRSPLETVPASPIVNDFGSEVTGRTKSPSPRKLRKANSEGGSMAAKARQQAMAAELAQEKTRSPAIPTFPNKSATALGVSDGAMF